MQFKNRTYSTALISRIRGRGRNKRFREVQCRSLLSISLTEFRNSNCPPKQMVLSPCSKIPHGFPSLLAKMKTPCSSDDLHDLTLPTALTSAPYPRHSSHKDLPSNLPLRAASWTTHLPSWMLLSPVILLGMAHSLISILSPLSVPLKTEPPHTNLVILVGCLILLQRVYHCPKS